MTSGFEVVTIITGYNSAAEIGSMLMPCSARSEVISRSFCGDQVQKLPLYTYVPGLTPHPVGEEISMLQGGGNLTDLIQHGRRLFNHGFYWEAHEAWESAWIEVGRKGEVADTIKAFIKLAACGVKCLEQNERGAVRHATRAGQLFRGVTTMNDVLPTEALRDQLEQFSVNLMNAPPIAGSESRLAAKQGGVPLLGPLPE